tara:strand:+ start:122 stop:424 length:303 start_codon:yes stop_codon:yes gene_type:complete
MSRRSFSEPTFEESSLQERVTSFYRNYEHADDPVALMRAQRDLDTIVMRCQHDDTLPNPFEFFKGTGDAGPMRFDAQTVLRFIDNVQRILEQKRQAIFGV